MEIRVATKEDCKAIRDLIQELADFEKMPDGPKINAKGKKNPDPIFFFTYDFAVINEFSGSWNKVENIEIELENLEKDGFGEHPLFQSFVAEKNGKIVGYAIYYYTYSTWGGRSMYLEDLYVIPEVRKKRAGSILFDAVAKKAVDMNCWRLDFTVLEWNPATDFYKHKGAMNITETEKWHHYRMDKDALRKLVENSSK